MQNKISRKTQHILTTIILTTCLSFAGCASQLTLSAESGDVNQVKTLLDQGADPNSSQDSYYPPLMAAIRPNPSPAIVKLLLDRGANPDKAGYGGYRALHWAAKFGETEIVKILLEHGANPEVTTTEGHSYTPLKLANENGHTIIARMLTEAVEARSQNFSGSNGPPPHNAPPLSTKTLPYKSLDMASSGASSPITAPTAVPADKTGAITTPNFKAAPDQNAVAIVIGIEKYQTLPTAGFVRSDAGLMRDYLKAMGYQDRNIEFLIDDRATFSSIRKAVETWLPNRINAKSRVIVYYAGHGAPDPQSGDAYIVPYDGDPNYLPDTGYPLKRLYERLERLPAKQVVVMIDACFSGAGGRGVLATGARSLVRVEKVTPKGSRIAVLTSTQGNQISTSSSEKQHGLFTYYLLKALQDNNRDLASVYDYLRSRVEDEAKRMNVEQTPAISPDSSAIRGAFSLW